jgi:hypothetical protein
MIQHVAEAVGDRLASFYGSENVFAGADFDGSLPFVHFNIQGAQNNIEIAGSPVTGAIWTVTVAVNCFSLTYSQAAGRIDEISETFASSYPDLEEGAVQSIHPISYAVNVEEERKQDGQTVYRGILILEVSVTHG